jgi:2-oxo-4-hydroxy-4-carboxy-5-ureidoimidazoline decarboxylase
VTPPHLEKLNKASIETAFDIFLRCCHSKKWAVQMVNGRPYTSRVTLLAAADAAWRNTSPDDWREAFDGHPRIGDKAALRAKFAATAQWAANEQSGAMGASEAVLDALAKGNRDYEARFGHIFIVCATGKSADEMLKLLKARMANGPDTELRIAAGEQAKITRLRLEKLVQEGPPAK